MLQGSDPNRVEIETKDPIQVELVQNPKKKKTWKERFENFGKFTSPIANILVLIGISFSVYQFTKTTNFNEQIEKRKNAIAAIDKIYSDDFLDKYDEIINNRLENEDQIDKAFDLVFNTYYIISVMYNDGIVDKSIIIKAIGKSILRFTSISIYYDKEKEATEYNKFAFEEIYNMIQDFTK